MSRHAQIRAARDEPPDNIGAKRWWALGSGGSIHALHDGFTDTLYVLLPVWAEMFGLSYVQVGFLKTLFSGAMAGLQVPMGILAERWGERRLLALGTVMLGVGYAGFGVAGGLTGLVLCLAFAGIGSSVQHPLASSIIARAFGSGPHRAALGMYNFTGDLGKVVFPAAMAFGIAYAGWERSSLAFGAVAVTAGIGIYLVLRRIDLGSRPAGGELTGPGEEGNTKGWGIHQRGGFASLSGIGVIDGATRSAFLTFLPFLLTAKGADVKAIGIALALTFAGGACGKLLCGLAAERFGIIRSVVVTEFATGTIIVALVALPLEWTLVTLPILGIALNGTSSVLYGTVGDFVDPDRRSRTFGLFYTMVVGASATAPAIYGLIGDAVGLDWALRITGALVFFTLPLCLAIRPALARVEQRQSA